MVCVSRRINTIYFTYLFSIKKTLVIANGLAQNFKLPKLTTEELLQCQSLQAPAGTRANHILEQGHSSGRNRESSTYKL